MNANERKIRDELKGGKCRRGRVEARRHVDGDFTDWSVSPQMDICYDNERYWVADTPEGFDAIVRILVSAENFAALTESLKGSN